MTKPMNQHTNNGLDDQFMTVLQESFPAEKKAELKASFSDSTPQRWWKSLFSNKTQKRGLIMRTNKMRPALLTLLALLTLSVLAFSFSPTVRAAVQSMFSFNGVNVIIDEETGKLSTEGNLDAVVFESDNMVVIEGGDGAIVNAPSSADEEALRTQIAEQLGVSPDEVRLSVNEEMEMPLEEVLIEEQIVVFGGESIVEEVGVDEILTENPNLALLTNLPSGYEMNQTGFMDDSGLVGIYWQNGNGDTITYIMGEPTMPELSTEEKDALQENNIELVDTGVGLGQGFAQIPGLGVSLRGETDDGVTFSIMATDKTLTEADLNAMIP